MEADDHRGRLPQPDFLGVGRHSPELSGSRSRSRLSSGSDLGGADTTMEVTVDQPTPDMDSSERTTGDTSVMQVDD